MKKVVCVERKNSQGYLESFALSKKAMATFDCYGRCTGVNWEDDIFTKSNEEIKYWDIRDGNEIVRFLNQVGTDFPESKINYSY